MSVGRADPRIGDAAGGRVAKSNTSVQGSGIRHSKISSSMIDSTLDHECLPIREGIGCTV